MMFKNHIDSLTSQWQTRMKNDENYPTTSSDEQKKIEQQLFYIEQSLYQELFNTIGTSQASSESGSTTSSHNLPTFVPLGSTYNSATQLLSEFDAKSHLDFLCKGANSLSSEYIGLDASQPWLVYWMLHSLDLLNVLSQPNQQSQLCNRHPFDNLEANVIRALELCKWKGQGRDKESNYQDYDYDINNDVRKGAYGGGYGQIPHLAANYAAVMGLCALGSEKALSTIDKEGIYKWLLSLKDPSGGFRVTEDGEVDARGIYCALAVASILNILDDRLKEGCAEFLSNLQAFDGGLGGEAGSEGHGGYTFCGVAALHLLGKINLLNIEALERWLALKQMTFEGGFQGRTNKLVDGCYSFWQGATFTLLNPALLQPEVVRSWDNENSATENSKQESSQTNHSTSELESHTGVHKRRITFCFNERELERYVLNFCQDKSGGLRDKPGKAPDFYHTCYVLSGLSICQWIEIMCSSQTNPKTHSFRLKRTHPVYNIAMERVMFAKRYFSR